MVSSLWHQRCRQRGVCESNSGQYRASSKPCSLMFIFETECHAPSVSSKFGNHFRCSLAWWDAGIQRRRFTDSCTRGSATAFPCVRLGPPQSNIGRRIRGFPDRSPALHSMLGDDDATYSLLRCSSSRCVIRRQQSRLPSTARSERVASRVKSGLTLSDRPQECGHLACDGSNHDRSQLPRYRQPVMTGAEPDLPLPGDRANGPWQAFEPRPGYLDLFGQDSDTSRRPQ